jgi:hypothetical protein
VQFFPGPGVAENHQTSCFHIFLNFSEQKTS